jgi:hypothetical protein
MNRRSFLAALGLAPVVAAGASVASPNRYSSGGRVGNFVTGEVGPEGILPLRRNAEGRLGVDANANRPVPVSISEANLYDPRKESLAGYVNRVSRSEYSK